MIGRLVRAGILAVVALVGIAGCGVGAQSAPHEIDRSDVPFGLARRAADTPTTSPGPTRSSYTIYLVEDDQLRAVTRRSPTALTPAAVLSRLVQGPTPREADAGLRTLLTPDLAVDHVEITDGVATVDLEGAGTVQPAGKETTLALAQLVYTATALPGVERVRFRVDGRPAEIPRGDGTLTKNAVSRADYDLSTR